MTDDTPDPQPGPLREAEQLLEAATELAREMRFDEAASRFRRALAALDALASDDLRVQHMRAHAHEGLAVIATSREALDEATQHHQRSLELRLELAGDPANHVPLEVPIAVTWLNMSGVAAASRRLDDAEQAAREALAWLDRASEQPGTLALLRLGAWQSLAMVQATGERLGESIETFALAVTHARELLASEGEGDVPTILDTTPEILPTYVQLLLNASLALHAADQHVEAASAASEAGEVAEALAEISGDDDAATLYLTAQVNLVTFCEAAGQFADAEDALFKALHVAPGHPDLLARGRRLYRDLLALDDATLAAGDLPRDEVEESLARLEAMATP